MSNKLLEILIRSMLKPTKFIKIKLKVKKKYTLTNKLK